MKKLSLLVLVLLASNSYAADAYNGKEYKMRQSLQNLNITGTGNNSIDINGGGDIDGQLTINSTVTITGNSGVYGLEVSSNVKLAGVLYTKDGNVGIGATAPATALSFGGSAPTISIATIDTADNQYLQLSGGGGFGTPRGGGIIIGGNESAVPGQIYIDQGNVANAKTSFRYAGGSVAMTILGSNGNVGIGTTAPGAKLDVTGDANISTSLTASSVTVTGGAFSVGGSTFTIKETGQVGINISPVTNVELQVGARGGSDSTPQILVGATTAAGTTLTNSYIRTDGGDSYIDNANEGSKMGFRLSSASDIDTTIMMLKTTGVGIGTTAPDSKISISSSTTSTAFVSFLGAMTKAEILAFDPVQAGASAYCTDCTAATLCISTGATASQFADIGDRTVACN